MTEVSGFVAGFAPVPSLSGSTAAIYFVLAVAMSIIAAWSVRGRDRSLATTLQAAAVGLLVLAAMTRLPSELSTRHTQWQNQRGFDAASAEAEVQRSFGVDPAFLEFADRTIAPLASFAVFIGSEVRSSAPQSWLQWALMPRIEEYQRPCLAQWIVLFGLSDPPSPIQVSERKEFAPGYAIIRNETPCKN